MDKAKKYYLSKAVTTWNNGMISCAENDMNFAYATVQSEAENLVSLRFVAWVGITDMWDEGNFRKYDGFRTVLRTPSSTILYWMNGEPNNAGGNEDCVQMSEYGRFWDNACSVNLPFICMR